MSATALTSPYAVTPSAVLARIGVSESPASYSGEERRDVPRHIALNFDALRLRARRDMRLKGRAASLFEDILDMSVKRGYCWKDNAEFAKLYGVTKKAIKDWMRSLRSAGYVSRKLEEGEWRTYPTWPKAEVEGVPNGTPTGGTKRAPGGTDGTPGGDQMVPSQGVPNGTHTIDHKYSPSESVTRARARDAFGQLAGSEAIEVYAEVTGLTPPPFFASKIAALVTADASRLDVWREVCLVWKGTHDPSHAGRAYNLANVPGMLDAFREALTRTSAPGTSTPGHSAPGHSAPNTGHPGAARPDPLAGLDLTGQLTDWEMRRLVGQTPGLERGHFYKSGLDPKNQPMWTIRPDHADRLPQ